MDIDLPVQPFKELQLDHQFIHRLFASMEPRIRHLALPFDVDNAIHD